LGVTLQHAHLFTLSFELGVFMRVLAAVACAFVVSVSAVSAQEATLDPQLAPMRAHYNRLAQAYAEADLSMVAAYRTPDFYVELPGGARLDNATVLRIVQTLFTDNTDEPLTASTDITCARMINENYAEFIVVQNLEQTVELDQPRRVRSATQQTETWRLTADGWRLASISDIHALHRWVDGVEVDPSRPYNPNAPAFTSASVQTVCPGDGYSATPAAP
jgi:hypothetical protein